MTKNHQILVQNIDFPNVCIRHKIWNVWLRQLLQRSSQRVLADSPPLMDWWFRIYGSVGQITQETVGDWRSHCLKGERQPQCLADQHCPKDIFKEVGMLSFLPKPNLDPFDDCVLKYSPEIWTVMVKSGRLAPILEPWWHTRFDRRDAASTHLVLRSSNTNFKASWFLRVLGHAVI